MGALAACFVVATAPTSAFADPAHPAPTSKPSHEIELRGVEDTMRASEAQRRRIEADIETQRADRARLNSALIETTAKVQDAERGQDAAATRLANLNASEKALRDSLQSRRDVIASVLAALQRLGRNPPPAILVRPHDMAQAIRSAMLLGAVLPDLQEQARALADDLGRLADLRTSIAIEQDEFTTRAKALVADRDRLTGLVAARQQAIADAEHSLDAERERASELAKQAASLKELITRMETEDASAKAGAQAARDADAAAVADIKSRAAAAEKKDPARLKPALAFAEVKGQLALPVVGAVLKTFGAPDGFGAAEKGISIATPASATVSAPADGWVAFSGPYRSYGQLLIINAGAGYYVVMAGMERINVSVGQFILAGEPVASMGDGSTRTATAAAIGAEQPVLYIEFRKDGAAIDPGPWWVKPDMEKARG
jgi:septal ring factor EnvC (AmiA/AmiB activator)